MVGRARLKLTAFYVATVLVLVLSFSLGMLGLFDLDFFSGLEVAPEGDHFNLSQEFETATDRKLLISLAIVDPVIIALSLAGGWFLAGRTLGPIQNNLKRQKQFVSDAAHELRTPLSIMKAGIETIEAGGKPDLEDYRELNSELAEEIERMIGLSNDLLFLSRGDFGAAAVKSPVNVSEACNKEVNVLQPYASQKDVRIRTDIDPGLYCLGDESQISQLLLNLLKNAVDYNHENGTVDVLLKRQGKRMTLTVTDTGIGIDPQDLPHIFKRFYKVDDARERSTSGTGLGLSIVSAIVESHGGDLKVQSEPGTGTQMIVTLDAIQSADQK